jgi:hypothetical protein
MIAVYLRSKFRAKFFQCFLSQEYPDKESIFRTADFPVPRDFAALEADYRPTSSEDASASNYLKILKESASDASHSYNLDMSSFKLGLCSGTASEKKIFVMKEKEMIYELTHLVCSCLFNNNENAMKEFLQCETEILHHYRCAVYSYCHDKSGKRNWEDISEPKVFQPYFRIYCQQFLKRMTEAHLVQKEPKVVNVNSSPFDLHAVLEIKIKQMKKIKKRKGLKSLGTVGNNIGVSDKIVEKSIVRETMRIVKVNGFSDLMVSCDTAELEKEEVLDLDRVEMVDDLYGLSLSDERESFPSTETLDQKKKQLFSSISFHSSFRYNHCLFELKCPYGKIYEQSAHGVKDQSITQLIALGDIIKGFTTLENFYLKSGLTDLMIIYLVIRLDFEGSESYAISSAVFDPMSYVLIILFLLSPSEIYPVSAVSGMLRRLACSKESYVPETTEVFEEDDEQDDEEDEDKSKNENEGDEAREDGGSGRRSHLSKDFTGRTGEGEDDQELAAKEEELEHEEKVSEMSSNYSVLDFTECFDELEKIEDERRQYQKLVEDEMKEHNQLYLLEKNLKIHNSRKFEMNNFKHFESALPSDIENVPNFNF